jgi:two-component system alkaline phosphatase synthesis response regulator PhoP
MIIDDEEDMRIYLQTLFRKAGFDTEVAVNGEEALAKINEIKPDLITLDILMPQKSGLNFFKSIRENNTTEQIPVIVVSGVTGHQEFFSQEKLGGPTYFVEKPIKPDALLEQVNKLLGE